jgi:hypothetical protein
MKFGRRLALSHCTENKLVSHHGFVIPERFTYSPRCGASWLDLAAYLILVKSHLPLGVPCQVAFEVPLKPDVQIEASVTLFASLQFYTERLFVPCPIGLDLLQFIKV